MVEIVVGKLVPNDAVSATRDVGFTLSNPQHTLAHEGLA